jgi:hypothetical protein
VSAGGGDRAAGRNWQHWAVSVDRNGENILTIDANCLSGRDLSDEDVDCIENCARHLLAFIGRDRQEATR